MLSLGDKVRTYPDFVVRQLCGANETRTIAHRVWGLISGGTQYNLADDDHMAVVELTSKVQREFVTDNGLSSPFSIDDVLKIRAYAERCVVEASVDSLKILFIADDSLASLRRYIIPARAMNHARQDDTIVDCCGRLDLHHALSYDIIVVGEIKPQDFSALQRLQDMGKIIVFDLNEALFNIPSNHPKALTFTPLDRELHYELLQMVDFVSVRHISQAEALMCVDKSVILPDMVEMAWIVPSPLEHRPDCFNIVCFTDETQQSDVELLDEVIEKALSKLPSARVTFVGCVPERYREILETFPTTADSDEFLFLRGKVHHIPYPSVKNYYRMLSQIPIDLALIPRVTNDYNTWGSGVDVLEMLAKGVPVLASKVRDIYTDPFNIMIGWVESMDDWEDGIQTCYGLKRDTTGQADRLAIVRAKRDSFAVGTMWVKRFHEMMDRVGRLRLG